MKAKVFSIPVFSIRRIETPYERSLGYKNYVAVVDARQLPDLKDWRKINVRDARLRGRVPQAIRRSFAEQGNEFFFMNRGLVLAADKVDFKESGPGGKAIAMTMRDPEIHGLLDGGHTYRVVIAEVCQQESTEEARYVRMEIITGFDRETISDVVDARNTSNQVRDESLANLRQEFEPIKDVLKGQPYCDQIAWSEYEELPNGDPKPIDIREIISYLITFDAEAFNSTTQPLISYKDKRACLRHFQENNKSVRKLYPILPAILRLWDEIHDHWPSWYGEGREEEAGIRGRFGKLTAVTQTEEPLLFKGGVTDYRMPDAYKYPILSALRAAVRVDRLEADWSTDPFALLNDTGRQLAAIVGNTIRATNNPNKVGKDVGTWSNCYLVVESALRGTMTQEAERKIHELEAQLAALKKTRGVA
jgi:hypothetical protein